MLFHGAIVSLILNVKKTKELLIDFSKSTFNHQPLNLQGCGVDIGNKFKYLDVIGDQPNVNRNYSSGD